MEVDRALRRKSIPQYLVRMIGLYKESDSRRGLWQRFSIQAGYQWGAAGTHTRTNTMELVLRWSAGTPNARRSHPIRVRGQRCDYSDVREFGAKRTDGKPCAAESSGLVGRAWSKAGTGENRGDNAHEKTDLSFSVSQRVRARYRNTTVVDVPGLSPRYQVILRLPRG